MNLTRIRAGAFALALILLPGLALAQSTPVYQSGTLSKAHNLPKMTRNGQIQDASPNGVLGDGNGLGVNPFAILDKLGLGVCSNSAPTGGIYSAICLGHTANGDGLLSLAMFGTGAPAFNIQAPNAIGITAGANLTLSAGGATAATATASGLALAGTPTAPTPSPSDSSTKLATTAYVNTVVGGAGVTPVPVVTTNAAMVALAQATTSRVMRLGVAAQGDAPPVIFESLTGNCVANSLTSDTGYCVNANDGNSWKASYPGEADVREWGATSSGDASAAMNAAAVVTAAQGLRLKFPGQTFQVCANPFQPPNGSDIYGQANLTKIQTQIGCALSGALAATVQLPSAAAVNPSLAWGRMHDIIIDGYGLSQYVLYGQFVSQWAFPGVTVRNAKPATVQTVTTSALTAVGAKVLTLSSARAVFQNATIVDDLTRPGIVTPGNVIVGCAPSCNAATTITLDRAITKADDGAGILNGDTIRLINPTANVYLASGDQNDFSQNFNVQNINDVGHVGGDIYTTQTTLPMACIYLPGFGGFSSLADSAFDGAIVTNCMYGVIDSYGLGNSYGKHFHAWGQIVFAGQPYDLRMQYGLAIGGADWIADWDVDDAIIAGAYVANSGLAGVAGATVRDGFINFSGGSPLQSNVGVLLQSGLQYGRVSGNRDLSLSASGLFQSIVYQMGVPDPTTVVRDQFDALYTTTPARMTGNAVAVTLSTTPTYLGPTGGAATAINGWIAPCTGFVTGHTEVLFQGGALGQNVTFTIEDGGSDVTGTAQVLAAGSFLAGQKVPPANIQILTTSLPVAAGDPITLKAVYASGSVSANLSYQITQTCRQGG